MGTRRKEDPAGKKSTSHKRTWTPTKYKGEVSELLELTGDPWSESAFYYRSFRTRRPPNPSDVLAFWEWNLLAQYWHEAHLPARLQPWYTEKPKMFWEWIQCCECVKALCAAGHRAEDLHAVLEILESLNSETFKARVSPELEETPKRGTPRELDKGGHEFYLQLQEAMLAEFLRPVAPGSRRWRMVQELVLHFAPQRCRQSKDPTRTLRRRIETFLKRYPEDVARHKKDVLGSVRYRMAHLPRY